MNMRLLGGLAPRAFLRRHWQKRPLFVRGALTGLRDMVDAKSLLRLAARDDVETRLVERTRGRWRVTEGPVRAAGTRRGGQWTVLVSGVNLHVPQADALLRRFDFVPQARLDDVMVSYAARGAGVGPHVDSYDVFLLQGAGRRRWRLCHRRRFRLVEGSPLRQVADFSADMEYVAETGDLLYVPPGWAHDGVALEPCLTYSIGFRAPRGAELGAAFLDWLHERGLPDAAYRDPWLAPTRRPGRLPTSMVDFAASALRRIRWSRADVVEFLGRYLSAPKPNVIFHRSRARAALGRSTVRLAAKTQLLYFGRRFFINGEAFRVEARHAPILRELADRRELAGTPLAGLVKGWQRSGFVELRP
jgi:50S ribosomal protein L16 3-hydroxylase